MIIAVDFDGTIHDGQWPRIGEAMPGAREAINALRAEGHYIIIWTCREGRQQTEMVLFYASPALLRLFYKIYRKLK
ncbi:hypothetical protein [uncultured Campylobacter sp.]|uniref:hypothetical protein n=1 Tax=uncultured Campylobacter sp. TaxID=218934 RepID=UPI002606276B|nr:hypothetical protein [uncultured Campylobacter sp.]